LTKILEKHVKLTKKDTGRKSDLPPVFITHHYPLKNRREEVVRRLNLAGVQKILFITMNNAKTKEEDRFENDKEAHACLLGEHGEVGKEKQYGISAFKLMNSQTGEVEKYMCPGNEANGTCEAFCSKAGGGEKELSHDSVVKKLSLYVKHVAAAVHTFKRNWDHAVVMEDDVYLTENFLEGMEKLQEQMQKIPSWGAVSIGRCGAQLTPQGFKVDENLYYTQMLSCSHGYYLSHYGASLLMMQGNVIPAVAGTDNHFNYIAAGLPALFQSFPEYSMNINWPYDSRDPMFHAQLKFPEQTTERQMKCMTTGSPKWCKFRKGVVDFEQRFDVYWSDPPLVLQWPVDAVDTHGMAEKHAWSKEQASTERKKHKKQAGDDEL